jgi:hypothetical protein
MHFKFCLLFLPAMCIGQINAEHLVAEKYITEQMSTGCVVQVDVIEKGKTSNYTALDEEFTVMCNGRPVDLAKSIGVAFDKAKAAKVKIELVDKGGRKMSIDPAKDDKKSALTTLEAAVKAGYKKETIGSVKE